MAFPLEWTFNEAHLLLGRKRCGATAVRQFWEEGQSDGHRTVGGSAGKAGVKPQMQGMSGRGPGRQSEVAEWGAPASVSRQKTSPPPTAPDSSLGRPRGSGALESAHPELSLPPFCLNELGHSFTAQPSRLRLRAGNQQDGHKEGGLEM